MNTRMTEKNGRVDDIIQKLCNNNIKTVTLQQICNKITTGKLDANAMEEGGQYPFFTCSRKMYKINSYRFDCEALIIAGNGEVGETKYYKGKFDAYQRTYVLYEFNEEIDVQYLFHYLRGYLKPYVFALSKKGSIPYITLGILKNFPIPLPPLSIQQEIVRILDTFTNLTAELTAELTARRKQYEYYRDELLTFGEDVPKVSLSELARFTYGFTDKAKETGDTRFIRITDIDDNGNLRRSDAKYITLTEESRKYLLKKGDILLARTGATYGKTLYIPDDTPAVFASFLIKIELDNSRILNRYYWHFAKSTQYWTQAEKYVSKAGQQQFNSKAVGRVLVPIPPLGVQQKIVDILDKFDKLCADIGDGLPAEIEARQRQYGYYRGQLLKFDN